MAQVGSLYTSLTLESSSFVVGLRKAVDQTAKSSKAIEGHLGRIRTGFEAVSGLIAGGALVAAGKRALDYASSLGEVAQQLGVTTRELQVYRFAASQVGLTQEEMDAGLQKLTRTMGEALAGNKAAVMTFRELGVSLTDANGKVLSAGQIIPRIADALARIKDPASRARVEVDLFGRAGQKLDPLLTQGARGVGALADEAERAGLVLSDKLIGQADEAADKLAMVRQQLEARLAKTVAENATSIVVLANSLSQLASSVAQFLGSNPERAAAILGALSGGAIGARFGPLGAAGGAYLGGMAGWGYAARNTQGGLNQQLAANSRALEPYQRSPGMQKLPQYQTLLSRRRELLHEIERMRREQAGPAAQPSSLLAGLGFGASAPSSGALPVFAPSVSKAKKAKKDSFDIAHAWDEISNIMPEPIKVLEDGQEAIAALAEDSSLANQSMEELAGWAKRTGDELMEAERASQRFTSDLADGLADAIVYGGDLGDVLINSFKRAAAEAISSGLFDILSGGGSGGSGGFFSSILSAGSSILGGGSSPKLDYNLEGFATGGSFKVGGMGGIDSKLVAFRATPGEMVNISRPGNDSHGGRVMIVPSPYFDVVVDHRAAAVAAPMATRAAAAGGVMGEQRMRRRESRALA